MQNWKVSWKIMITLLQQFNLETLIRMIWHFGEVNWPKHSNEKAMYDAEWYIEKPWTVVTWLPFLKDDLSVPDKVKSWRIEKLEKLFQIFLKQPSTKVKMVQGFFWLKNEGNLGAQMSNMTTNPPSFSLTSMLLIRNVARLSHTFTSSLTNMKMIESFVTEFDRELIR